MGAAKAVAAKVATAKVATAKHIDLILRIVSAEEDVRCECSLVIRSVNDSLSYKSSQRSRVYRLGEARRSVWQKPCQPI